MVTKWWYQPWSSSSNNNAIFSAGDDATGHSSIAADLDVTLLGLTVGEGDITISAGSWFNNFIRKCSILQCSKFGSSLTINEALDYGNNDYSLT